MIIFVLLFAEIDSLRFQVNNPGDKQMNDSHSSMTKISNYQIKHEIKEKNISYGLSDSIHHHHDDKNKFNSSGY